MKPIYLTIIFLCFSFFANAQISVGARVGLNFANQRIEFNGIPPDRGPRSIKVIDLALPIEISLSEEFSIQPEFHFTRKGEEIGFINDTLESVSIKCQYDYIDIPILLKKDFNSGGGKLYLIGGPLFSYGLGGTEFITVGELKEENEINFEDLMGLGEARIYDRFNIGVVLGGGLEIPLTRGRIVGDLRYGISFDNVFEETDATMGVLTAKNYAITISIGYMYDFGKPRKSKKKEVDGAYEILK